MSTERLKILSGLALEATRLAEAMDDIRDRMMEADLSEAAIDQARIAATNWWDVAGYLDGVEADEAQSDA